MRWRPVSSVVAESDKGYALRVSYLQTGSKRVAFYNAWAPTGKHVWASHNKAEVLAECDAHYARQQVAA